MIRVYYVNEPSTVIDRLFIDAYRREIGLDAPDDITGRMLADIRAAAAQPQAGLLRGHVEDIGFGTVAYLPLPSIPPGQVWANVHALYEKMFGEPWPRSE